MTPAEGRVSVPPEGWDAEALTRLGGAIGFGEGRSRYIGGWVRDQLAGVVAGDLDIGTQLAPEAVVERARAAGLHVWTSPSGLAHGTVGVVVGGRTIEVTTLRRDEATDGRYATVAFTDDWAADAARRDFTINALSADPVTGAVYDYFGGRADLQAGTVRFIGDPLRRIGEDHLRILRFFRFFARFGGSAPEPDGFAACRARANDLMALSRERIADELLKMLAHDRAGVAIDAMLAGGILAPVVPEIDAAGHARLVSLIEAEAAAGIAGDPVRRLAALVPVDQAEEIGARLKLSNVQKKRLAAASGPLLPPRELAYRVGTESAVDRLLLGGEAGAARLLADWTPPRLPLSGGALVARGLRAGPLVARGLKMVEERWIAEGFPARTRADALADQVAAELLAIQ